MISEKDCFAGWVALIDGLDEAKEHLADLTNQLHSSGQMNEAEFSVYLGHIYAHLNRAWNGRNRSSEEWTDEEWNMHSQFPRDIEPNG